MHRFENQMYLRTKISFFFFYLPNMLLLLEFSKLGLGILFISFGFLIVFCLFVWACVVCFLLSFTLQMLLYCKTQHIMVHLP